MKPPATVWITMTSIDMGKRRFAVDVNHTRPFPGDINEGDTIRRYRLDTPKPRKAKKRGRRG